VVDQLALNCGSGIFLDPTSAFVVLIFPGSFFFSGLFSRNGRNGMEIETIPLETELSTQTKKNPASQRPVPIDVSFVGFGTSLFCFV